MAASRDAAEAPTRLWSMDLSAIVDEIMKPFVLSGAAGADQVLHAPAAADALGAPNMHMRTRGGRGFSDASGNTEGDGAGSSEGAQPALRMPWQCRVCQPLFYSMSRAAR